MSLQSSYIKEHIEFLILKKDKLLFVVYTMKYTLFYFVSTQTHNVITQVSERLV